MRIRPSALASILCLALFSVACNSGNMEGQPAEQYGAASQDTAQDLELWQPITVEDCARVDAFLEETETSFASSDTGSVNVDIHLSDGSLEASPGPIAVSRGQTVRWYSDGLHWTLRFAGDVSPFGEATMEQTDQGPSVIRGEPGEEVEVQVPEDARCGLYHYVAAAADAEGNLYALDPPMVVKD